MVKLTEPAAPFPLAPDVITLLCALQYAEDNPSVARQIRTDRVVLK
jgi:hypothetical protein